jgi:peptide/nickel transport system substrate-binding protein
MFKYKRAAVIAVAAALTLAGCSSGGSGGSGGSSGSAGNTGGTLTLGVAVPNTTFAAQNSAWANESPYMQAVYDTLLKADPDGTVKPNLATKWSYNADKTQLTLTLRNDVKFTDGTPFNADVAVQNLLRFRDGTSPNKGNLANLADAKKTDDTHLVLTLKQPDPAMLTYLSQNSGLQESPKAFTASNVATVPVGSGPYTLDTGTTVAGSSYVFTKNPKYWNPSDQHYSKIVMNVYSDPTATLNAIQGGQVNVSSVTDNTAIPQIESAGFKAVAQELDWQGLLLSDRQGTLTPALKEVKVRQAINYALDRPAILKALGAGYGTVTEQVFPTYSPSFDAALDKTYSHDVAKAKKLMSDAGYGSGFTLSMPRVSLLPAASFTLIADQLSKIGITVQFTDEQISDYISKILGHRYSASIFQLQQDPTDWQLTQFQIAAASPWNTFHIADPTVEGLIAKIQTGDQSTAAKAGKELNKYVVDNAWFAPFFRGQNTKVVDANTKIQMQAGNTWPYLWNIQPK